MPIVKLSKRSKILLPYGKRPRTPLREGVECVSELGLHLLGDSFLTWGTTRQCDVIILARNLPYSWLTQGTAESSFVKIIYPGTLVILRPHMVGASISCQRFPCQGTLAIFAKTVIPVFETSLELGVLVEATTSTTDCNSYEKDWGNGCGSNETPIKGVHGNLHGSSRMKVLAFSFVYCVVLDLGVDSLSSSFSPLSGG
ncbi:hypothetical protein Tco_0552036 [Tanacetum coccineum]